MFHQMVSKNIRSSFGPSSSVMLSCWLAAMMVAAWVAPSQAAMDCGAAHWLTSPQGLQWAGDAGPTRLLLEVTSPSVLVIESSKGELTAELDGCGSGWGGRVVETSSNRRVLAFTEAGVYGLRVDGKGMSVQMRWIEVAAVPFQFRVWHADRGFFVHGVDLYSVEQTGGSRWASRGLRAGPPGGQGRHLGQLMSFEADAFDGRATLRAEIGTGIHPSLEHRPADPSYLLRSDVRIWNGTSPSNLDNEDEEQEVDPNEGGFTGTKPVSSNASLDNEDEEQEVDPNEGGFTIDSETDGEHLILTVHWSGDSCDAPADRRALARQWIELLSAP